MIETRWIEMTVTEMTVTGVLFDSDGVLVDSHRHSELAWRALCAEFDLDFEAVASTLAGVPAHQTLGRLLSGDTLAAATARLEDLEVETADDTATIPGAIELLAALPADRFAIVTSASRRLGEARWRGAGLALPRHTITCDDVRLGKPDPEPFLAGAALLGATPADCVVFEDSPAGCRAAVAAGMPVVAVGAQPWPTEPAARVTDLTAVHVVATGTIAITLQLNGVSTP
jgi:mannitol-1-/sugar-/sorbitol-6-phosphatase